MVLADTEIGRLIELEKVVSNPKARRLEKRGSEQVNYEAEAATGEKFRVYVRQNMRISEGFSCGLLYLTTGAASPGVQPGVKSAASDSWPYPATLVFRLRFVL